MKNRTFWIFILGIVPLLHAQEGKVINHIYDGNTQVEKEAYTDAEKSYRKALSLAPEKPEALYNLGNAHFLDEHYDEASQRFFQTQKFASSKEEKHRAFHNMGNVFMKKKEYQKAVEAYKNALRNNPSDDETRYNYALAKELLENEKPPEEQEQDDQKDQKDYLDKTSTYPINVYSLRVARCSVVGWHYLLQDIPTTIFFVMFICIKKITGSKLSHVPYI